MRAPERRADNKTWQLFTIFAVFMPFLRRWSNKRAVVVEQRAGQTTYLRENFQQGWRCLLMPYDPVVNPW